MTPQSPCTITSTGTSPLLLRLPVANTLQLRLRVDTEQPQPRPPATQPPGQKRPRHRLQVRVPQPPCGSNLLKFSAIPDFRETRLTGQGSGRPGHDWSVLGRQVGQCSVIGQHWPLTAVPCRGPNLSTGRRARNQQRIIERLRWNTGPEAVISSSLQLLSRSIGPPGDLRGSASWAVCVDVSLDSCNAVCAAVLICYGVLRGRRFRRRLRLRAFWFVAPLGAQPAVARLLTAVAAA